ncbi:MAG: hypothetical protein NTY07_20175 [Bacteroidia bacterium]|nr:hypothetical protein [Bacteroidia bacterium]
MDNRILYIVALFGLLVAQSLMAQEELPKNWNSEKIKGTRFIPYASYSGTPYLNEKFASGKIEFLDGTKVEDLKLRYSTYRDEIIYYNAAISAQIIIDKISLKGFAFTDDNGIRRVFRQQYFDGFMPGNRYFEVLSDGDIALLVYRKVVLLVCSPYNNNLGRLLNMSYQEAFSYYFYSKEKGYQLVRINKNSLLSKFDKPTQKVIKKILRKNDVSFDTEADFVTAWNLVKENGIKINF